MKIAKVIITEPSIPYSKNGSWTQRIEYFLKSDSNVVDYCICGETEQTIESKTVFFKVKQITSRILLKFFPEKRYQNHISQIKQLAQKYDHLIICVIDNLKLKKAISDYIQSNNSKEVTTLIFYSCGFSYFLSAENQKELLKNCDEYIFLSQSSYLFNKERYDEFTSEVTILNNPIQKNIFHPISKSDKEILTAKYGLEGKTIYLWLSHDREKKGLNLILNAWRDWCQTKEDVVLLVVGAKRNITIKNVQFIGEVESTLVHEYYKLAHVYLFPTLWKEGFGLSLAQAISSGCFCIAANNGSVKDFFNKQDGILIDNPNVVSNWTDAMENAYIHVQSGWENPTAGKQILNYEEWSKMFAQIFLKWEKRIRNDN
jgi:glycosyltransferase involved in cell wall biosynthesis